MVVDPEEFAAPPSEQTHLRLIPDSLVEVTPVEERIVPSVEEMLETLSEAYWPGMTSEELIKERDKISTFQGEVIRLQVELNQAFDEAHRKMLWINGMIRAKQKDEGR